MPSGLPAELLVQVFSYIRGDQKVIYACTLVSLSWYSSSVAFLYENPLITGKNYDAFVRAICPSVNAHIRHNGLAELVRRLDMSSLVHSGSKSLTARLLGRVKSKLEEFVAPQASFAVNCLAALSKCSRLRYLDLSFVSESIAMSDLLRSTSVLSKLEVLHLPRSSTPNTSIESASYGWPSRLREIHVSGGIHDESAHCLTTLPPSVSHLSIGNCPHLSMVSIRPILSVKGPQLLYLEIVAPIPALTLSPKPLNNILGLLPNLRRLKISLDFISLACFDVQMVMTSILPLREIDLDCFDPAECELLTAEDVSYGISNTHTWGNLRKVRIHRRLGWTKTQCAKRSVGELDEYLKALAKEDGPGAEIKEHEAGVIFFGKK